MQSELIDIGIGIVFVWFLLSMVLAAIGEGIALATHVRAKHLWLGLARLVDPSRTPLPRAFADAAINLPLRGRFDVRPKALTDPEPSKANRFTKRPAVKEPDLDGLRTEVQTIYTAVAPQLIEIAAPGRLSKITKMAGDALADALVSVSRRVYPPDLLAAAEALEWDDLRTAALRGAIGGRGDGEELSLDTVLGFRSGELSDTALRSLYTEATTRFTARDVAAYFSDNPQLKKALLDAAGAATGSERVHAVKATIDQWFEREMAQIRDFYRRQNRKILAVLAILLVLVVQSNAIELVQDLNDDATLRQAISGEAANTVAGDAIADVCSPSSTSTTTTAPPDDTATTSTTIDPAAAVARLECAVDIIGVASRFNVGWAWQDFEEAHGVTGSEAAATWADIWPFLTDRWAWLGRPITWIALLFGAQFWLDVLRRLIGLRGALSRNAPTAGASTT